MLIITGCSNEPLQTIEENSTDLTGLKIVNYSHSNAKKYNGQNRPNNSSKYNGQSSKSFTGTTIAAFENLESYNNHIESLEIQTEQWDDTFLAKWGHLSDDQLNAKEEELNFDSEKPLTDFEKQFGLQSLRQKYLNEEQAWLNNDVLDINTDPDIKPEYDFDMVEMTVLNHLAEVQIGTTITKKLNSEEIALLNNTIQQGASGSYNRIEEGARLIIEDEDYNALVDFNNGDTSVINNPNVSVSNQNSSTDCKYAKEHREFIPTSSNKQILALIKVSRPSLGWNGKVKAKIKSYKKGFLGWRRWRTNIDVGVRGYVYNGNCNNTSTYLNEWKGKKRRKKLVFKWRNQNFSSHKVENGGMKGLFKQNSFTKEIDLTW